MFLKLFTKNFYFLFFIFIFLNGVFLQEPPFASNNAVLVNYTGTSLEYCASVSPSPYGRLKNESLIASRFAEMEIGFIGISFLSDGPCRDLLTPSGCIGGLQYVDFSEHPRDPNIPIPVFGLPPAPFTYSIKNPDQVIPIPGYRWNYCKSWCLALYDTCFDEYAQGGNEFLLPNCDDERFSDDPLSVPHPETGDIVLLPCLNYTSEQPEIECPENRGLVNYENYCVAECPSPALTEDDKDSLWDLHNSVAMISFILSIFLIATYSIHPAKRLFPSRIVIFIAIACLILSFGFLLPLFAGSFEKVWCDETEALPSRAMASGSLCKFQGITIMYASLASAFWWAIFGFNTALIIFRASKIRLQSRTSSMSLQEGIYHIIGWIGPMIFVAIAAGTGNIGYTLYSTYCFVDSAPDDDNDYLIFCWILPISICLLVGSLSFIYVLFKIVQSAANNEMGSIPKRTISRMIRILVFLFFWLYAYIFVFTQKTIVEAQEEDREEANRRFLLCAGVPAIPYEKCQDFLANEFNLDSQMVSDFNLIAQGTILTGIFLIGWNFPKLWWNLITCKDLGEFATKGTRVSTNSSSKRRTASHAIDTVENTTTTTSTTNSI